MFSSTGYWSIGWNNLGILRPFAVHYTLKKSDAKLIKVYDDIYKTAIDNDLIVLLVSDNIFHIDSDGNGVIKPNTVIIDFTIRSFDYQSITTILTILRNLLYPSGDAK